MHASDPSFAQRALMMVRRIPYGKVAAYGDIAAFLGTPRGARGVGYALRSLPQDSDVPWWRVLNSNGEISIRHMGGRLQRMLLEQEGVRFNRQGRVDLSSFRWRPDDLAPFDIDE